MIRTHVAREDRFISTLLTATVLAGVVMVLITAPAYSQTATWLAGAGGSAYYLGPVGIGTTAPANRLHLQGGGSNTFTYFEVRNYSASPGWTAGLNMSQSNSNTVGVMSTTVDGQYISEWSFRGVDNNLAFRQAAVMDVLQDGASSATAVPGMYQFGTADGSGGGPITRLTIRANGNVGIGTTTPTFRLHVVGNAAVAGDLVVIGNIAAKYQDIAEWVPATAEVSHGTVVVLDKERVNSVVPSFSAYDTSVAGVVSDTPGILLGESGAGKVKVATTGRVRVMVDSSTGPIRVGDLLVTGNKPGMAMRSEPIEFAGTKIHRPGTIIGKALEPLPGGKGEILVLLSLQ